MTTLCETKNETLANEVLTVSQDLNETLAETGEVKFLFRSHYVDLATGEMGIESLIRGILIAGGCVHPAGMENTARRSIVVRQSMFASEVIAEVRKAFGEDRYPDKTIAAYLSCKNARATVRFGGVALTKEEDYTRICKRPRTKYYVVLVQN